MKFTSPPLRTLLAAFLLALPACTGAGMAATAARPATVSFAPGTTSSGEVPFTLYADNHLFLPAKVEGTPVEALLDSGAAASVISEDLAGRLGVQGGGRVNVLGSGGLVPARWAQGVDVEVGDLRITDLRVVVFEASELEARFGRTLPLVIGNDVFERLIVDIDVARKTVSFHDPRGFQPPPRALRIPLTRVRGVRTVEVSLEGRAPIPMLFDLGSGHALSLEAEYWQRERLPAGRACTTGLTVGVGGPRQCEVAVLSKVRIAGVEFSDVPVSFSPQESRSQPRRPAAGIVGLPLLSRFRMITDYANDVLYLVPWPKALSEPFAKDRLGLSLLHDSQTLRVDHVSRGSPAEASGFRVGEHIAAIDGIPASAWTFVTLSSLGKRPAGTVAEIRMQDGSVRRVVLRDYF